VCSEPSPADDADFRPPRAVCADNARWNKVFKILESIADEVYIPRVSRTLLARPAKAPSKRTERMTMATKKTTPPTKKAVTPKAAAPATAKKAETAPKSTAPDAKKAAPAASPAAAAPEKKAAPAKKAPKPAAAKPVPAVTPEERWQMISEAAYFLAEKRGFSGGNPCDDWVQAEQQVDALLIRRAAGK
jgi:hypothetical protein